MREIKFRGYDKEFEKMTYFDDEEYDYRPPLAFRLDQVLKKTVIIMIMKTLNITI